MLHHGKELPHSQANTSLEAALQYYLPRSHCYQGMQNEECPQHQTHQAPVPTLCYQRSASQNLHDP